MAFLLMLAICQEEDSRRVPRNRFRTPRCSAFDLSDEEFISYFRLSKTLASRLIEELNPFLEPKTLRKNALSTEIKVLCALNFFAFGCNQKKVGDDFLFLVSQSSVSKCICDVSEAMTSNLRQKYIKFPGDKSSQKAIKEKFLEHCGLEGVLGAIDCTHVAIVAPSNDGYHYVNLKGWYSVNVQLVCDVDMRILNVVARFPGCKPDRLIWEACNLKKALDGGYKVHGDCWLLGDSAYSQELHLHTPFSEVSPGSFEEEYNAAHYRGHSVVDRCNGMLKNRFRCLLKHKNLHYLPVAASKIIYSCTILHNLCVESGMQWDSCDLGEEDKLFDTISHC